MLGRCHLVTDPRSDAATRVVDLALAAGVDAVQVRIKDADDAEVLAATVDVLRRCRPVGAQCIVDDRLDVALAAGAHGVHLGETDLPVAAARAVAGDGLVIGATVRDPAAARAAAAAGASYLGVGPVRATTTKQGLPAPIGVDGVAAVCRATTLPVVAIGGIDHDIVPALLAVGVHGVAVVGAIHHASDPQAAARRLVAAVTGARP